VNPLANLFAVMDEDPFSLGRIEAALRAGRAFDRVWRPARRWIAARRALPSSSGDPSSFADQLAFAEGGDLFDAGSGARSGAIEDLIEVVDTCPRDLLRFTGDFGFIRFEHSGRASVVRSCRGLVPFYLFEGRGRAAISTRLGDIARYLPLEPRLDAFAAAIWTNGWPVMPDGRTTLAGARILDRGSYAVLRPESPVQSWRYWDPRPYELTLPTPAAEREHVEEFRDALIASLDRDLATQDNLLCFSGGVDSSALAAVARRVLGRPLLAISYLPPDPALKERDLSYITPLAAELGFARHWQSVLDPASRLALTSLAPRVVVPVGYHVSCALPRLVQEAPIRVVLGGEFADELCGSLARFGDWVDHTSVVDLLQWKRLPTGPRDALSWLRWRSRSRRRRPIIRLPSELSELYHPELRAEYREWRARISDQVAYDTRPHRMLTLFGRLDGWLAESWEAATHCNVRPSSPFCTRRLIEIGYRLHPREMLSRGTKQILRRAVADYLPSRHVGRADKGHWGHYAEGSDFALEGSLPAELEGVLKPDFFDRPPGSVAYWDRLRIVMLTNIVEGIREQRSARASDSAAALLPAAVGCES